MATFWKWTEVLVENMLRTLKGFITNIGTFIIKNKKYAQIISVPLFEDKDTNICWDINPSYKQKRCYKKKTGIKEKSWIYIQIIKL